MDLSLRIEAMWKRRGVAYQPRTRHLDESGRPLYTNRLFLESSPYLLQHAHNPVDWYPWGNEAFDDARRLDRPVLLSVGYSTCHWCHVMEEESFEDEEIARYINATYIAVKVDREERPDVDAVYMSAVQAITGRGGWPMTVWLTPLRKPFYGGTYFPARDGDRGSPVGFLSLLKNVRESYDRQREMVDRSAGELAQSIHRMLAPTAGSRLPTADILERAVAASKTRFDARYGGISGAPKFPSSLPIRLLLRHYHRVGDPDCLKMAVLTLERMAAGGMNDQVGGGFHRYSTDERWLVPHFEKMLYDNALLVPAYIEGWQTTQTSGFIQVARATLDYVAREMTDRTGGFYSAGDADSLTPTGRREEGYYFTWTRSELDAALGPHNAHIAAHVYGVSDGGNWEGRNVLHLRKNLPDLAVDLGLSAAELAAALNRIKRRLYEERRQRPAPLRDDKILVAWNGPMISALVRAGFALEDAGYINRASRAADFILEAMVDRGRLKRSYRDGVAGGNGFLEDYAFFTAALLDLFSVTAAPGWLAHAMALDQVVADHFEDRRNGGFFMTADDHEALIAREKPCFDGALPSGNAVALMNLIRLYGLTLDPAYRRRAEKGFTAFSAVMEASPLAFGEMLLALDDFLHPPQQVIAVSPTSVHEPSIAACLRGVFLPGSQVMMVSQVQADRLAATVPSFHGKAAVDGRTTVYVCRHGTCDLPVSDAYSLWRQLNRHGKDPAGKPGLSSTP